MNGEIFCPYCNTEMEREWSSCKCPPPALSEPGGNYYLQLKRELETLKESFGERLTSVLAMDLGYTLDNPPIYGHSPLRHQNFWSEAVSALGKEAFEKNFKARAEQYRFETEIMPDLKISVADLKAKIKSMESVVKSASALMEYECWELRQNLRDDLKKLNAII